MDVGEGDGEISSPFATQVPIQIRTSVLVVMVLLEHSLHDSGLNNRENTRRTQRGSSGVECAERVGNVRAGDAFESGIEVSSARTRQMLRCCV